MGGLGRINEDTVLIISLVPPVSLFARLLDLDSICFSSWQLDSKLRHLSLFSPFIPLFIPVVSLFALISPRCSSRARRSRVLDSEDSPW